ncbi:glutathione S-transferase [Mycena galopus ATCC 62051]|nr:glutathione S-transferase [Mycena galopus ATCC 62051]
MTILKIHGAKVASCTRRVATILHELHVPFELIEVDWQNQAHKTPEFLKYQPFGQVPYIDDEGFIMYESRAICRYIAAKYPASGLIPSDPKARALFEQAASVELSNFDPSASKAGVHLNQKKLGWSYNEAVITEQLKILDEKLDAYEVILSKHRYLAGETLTLADLFHLPYAAYVAYGGDIMTCRPNVARWYTELVSRPSWLAYEEGVVTTKAY